MKSQNSKASQIKKNNHNEFISAYQRFIKTGILPIIFILFFLFSCGKKREIRNIQIKNHLGQQYMENDLLNDQNDRNLNEMDTILKFTDIKFFYEVKIKKEQVNIVRYRWDELSNNKIDYEIKGFHKNGYVYTKDIDDTTKYSIGYKIILNKGLFVWNGRHWELINSGDY